MKRNKLAMLVCAASSTLGLSALPSTAAAQTAVAPDTGIIESVLVTATRRTSDIQDVPIAITAVDAERLDRSGILDITTLETVAPSFNMNNSDTLTGGSTFRIRGVGTSGNNTGLESSVGVFLDGVYLSRPGVALTDLLDIEQIEVLRGPQGTLFGRNTSAGALSIRTQRPNLDEAEGFLNLTAGNYSMTNVQGGFSAPLIEDTLAVRLSASNRQRDGFVDGLGDEESYALDRTSVRGQALWNFNDVGDVRIIADYAEGDDECCNPLWFNESAGINFEAFGLPADGGAPNIAGDDLDDYDANSRQFDNPFEQYGISAEFNFDLGIGSLTYIASYRDYEARAARDADFNGLRMFTVGATEEAKALGGQNFEPDNNPTFIETTTHELRLQNTAFDDRLDWLIGVYYSDEQIAEQTSLTLLDQYQAGVSGGLLGSIPLQPNPLFLASGGVDATGDFATNRFEQDGESISIFTHNVLSITDSLDLTLGLRYVEETKDGSYRQITGEHDACLGTLNTGAPIEAVALNCFIFAAPSIDRLQTLDPAQANNPSALALLPRHYDERFEDEELVYTVKASYEVSSDMLFYGGFTHGFKSGGFNLDSSAAVGGADPRFDSEQVDVWEIGMKALFWDRRLRANIAVFSQEMEDFQVQGFTGVRFQTFNVDKAESVGVELETFARFTDYFSGSLGLTYADTEYPNDCAPLDPAQPGYSPIPANLCGNALTNAPELVAIVGFTYERPIFDDSMVFFIDSTARYEDDRRTGGQPTELQRPDLPIPGDIQDSNTKVNLRFGLQSFDERWALEVWGNNIFDERTRNAIFNIPLRGAEGDRAIGQFVQEPATYGVTLRANF